MATFRQREGRWQAIIRRTDLKATKTFDRLKDARTWATAKERAADMGDTTGGTLTGTLRPVIERYEKEIWPTKRWGASKANELTVLKRDLGSRLLADLKRTVILAYLKGLQITPGGVASRLSYLKEVMRTARDLWGVPVPLPELEAAIATAYRQKLAGKSQARSRRPTPAEIVAIIAYAADRKRASIDLGEIVQILSVLPLRMGELVGIQWADLNAARRSAVIRGRKHPDIRVRERNDQEVPLIAFGGVDTYELIAGRPEYLPSPFPYNRTSVTAAFGQATLRCQIHDLHLHDLRAHAISTLLEGGLPIPQVALLSGHVNWKVLAKHYSRIDPASVHDALRRL